MFKQVIGKYSTVKITVNIYKKNVLWIFIIIQINRNNNYYFKNFSRKNNFFFFRFSHSSLIINISRLEIVNTMRKKRTLPNVLRFHFFFFFLFHLYNFIGVALKLFVYLTIYIFIFFYSQNTFYFSDFTLYYNISRSVNINEDRQSLLKRVPPVFLFLRQ